MKNSKTAWIIGASSGIGKSLALYLNNAGYKVAISARSSDKLTEVANGTDNIIPITTDVKDLNSVKAAMQSVKAALGRLDLVVICAGTYVKDDPYNLDPKLFQDTFDLNVMGTINCLNQIIPEMIKQGYGTIGVVSSVAGINGLPYASAYGGSKAALINICESLEPPLRHKGIDIKLINPGFIDTPLTKKNDFEMPFLISAEESAKIIYNGLKSNKFEIVYPWKMAWLMKFIHALPYVLKFKLTSLILKK